MSYLLDALNKSRGDENHQTSTPQPVMYQQTGFSSNEGVNVYKWISIVLALALTLLVGIVLGNKYSLTFTDKTTVQPTIQTQAPVQVPAQTAQPQIQTPVTQAPVEPVVAEKVQTKAAETVAKTQPAAEPEAQPEVPYNEEPIVVSGEPKKLKPVKELDDAGLSNISNELLQKFNQAIQDTQNVDADYAEVQDQQTDTELDEYFTKVPKVSELNAQQQTQIPSMTYETHLYSSDIMQRRVKINSKTLQEGSWVNGDIQVVEIQRQHLILEMGHIRFSLPALTDWQSIVE